jgi:hypothetical protein
MLMVIADTNRMPRGSRPWRMRRDVVLAIVALMRQWAPFGLARAEVR